MSRGRRDVLRSLTTLLVLGSMTMRLLVFSLLTNTSPVSLADAAESATAKTPGRAAPTTGVGWARAILFCLRKRLLPAYDLSKRPGKPPARGYGAARNANSPHIGRLPADG